MILGGCGEEYKKGGSRLRRGVSRLPRDQNKKTEEEAKIPGRRKVRGKKKSLTERKKKAREEEKQRNHFSRKIPIAAQMGVLINCLGSTRSKLGGVGGKKVVYP